MKYTSWVDQGYQISTQDGASRHFVFGHAIYSRTDTKFYRNIPSRYPKHDQMMKIDTGSKFKMAAAAILKSVKRP